MKMKRHRNVLLALTLALALTLGASLAFAQSGPAGGQQFPVGLNTISYQGRVTVNGQPYNGVGYFKFAIIDSQGNYTWNSDVIVQAQAGAQQIGAPQNPIQIPVNKGLFSVRLGAAPDMPPIPPQAVGDPDSALRVWFSADGTNFTQLPDRPFSAAPWAIMADTLDGYDSSEFAYWNHDHWGQSWSGSGTGLELQSNDGWGLSVSTGSANNLATAIYGKASSSTGQTVGVWGVTESGNDDAIGVWGQANNSNGKTYGVYGQNASTTDGAAGVFGWAQGANGETYGVKGQSNSQFGFGVYGLSNESVGVKGESSTWVGVYGVRGTQSSKAPLTGAGVWGDSQDSIGVFGSSEKAAAVFGFSVNNTGVAGMSDNSVGVQGMAPVTGTVGVATDPAGATYGVYGYSYSDDGYGVFGQGSDKGEGVRGESYAGKGVVGFSERGIGVYGSGWFFGNAGKFENATTITPTVIINNAGSSAGGPGLVVTGTTTIRSTTDRDEGALAAFNSFTNGTGIYGKAAFGVVGESDATDGSGVYGIGSGSDAIGVSGFNRSGGQAGVFVSEIAGNAVPDSHAVEIRNLGLGGAGPDGLAIVTPRAGDTPGSSVNFVTFFSGWNEKAVGAIEGNGSGGVVYKSGGADFAELLPAAKGLQPGDVVVIGPDGTLVRSAKANQTNVAGVYSTAPGFLGGMTPDMEAKEDAANSSRAPIAIVGIVPVKVSAENGAIRPGDLLTPSNTPGHAMKAKPVNLDGIEFYRPGTIIGKALEALDEGTGVIRVLITLH
ncbi:MAG: hypothetical protein GXP42_01285 [Chloroflexi bacterium]|nr:hypothetical protein [Chloroflexota bacterium]